MNYRDKCKRRRSDGPTPCLCCPGACYGGEPLQYPRYWARGPELWTSQCSVFYGKYGAANFCEWIVPGSVEP